MFEPTGSPDEFEPPETITDPKPNLFIANARAEKAY